MRRSPLWRFLILAVVACVSQAAGAAASNDEPRLALVIGTAAYPAGPLPTATDDAGLVAQSLAQDGFSVTAMGDPDAATLRETVRTFVEKVHAAGSHALVFVYVSGYGLQYAGENFYVPVEAGIETQADVPIQAVPLREIQSTIETMPARARVFAYDLARETPFAKADGAPLALGLTLVRGARGSLTAFNAAPGAVAWADVAPYGIYARALAEGLRMPGLTIRTLFARARLRVAEITGGATVPWDDPNLDDDVALVAPNGGPLTTTADASIAGMPEAAAYWTALAQDRLETYQDFVRAFSADPLALRVKAMLATRLEAATWGETLRVNSAAAYWTYMLRYPRGPHYVDVRRRLAAIHAAFEPPPRFDLYDFATLPPPTPEQSRAVDRPDPIVDDFDGSPTPPAPDDLLPPAAAAIYLELAPPPLVPRGVLPIPAPLAVGANKSALEVPGPIVQPFVPGLGAVSIASGLMGESAAMSLSTEVGLVTRTITAVEKGQRTIVQTDAADEILSRTTVARADGTLFTITQTGPNGGVLMKIVTRIDPLGVRVTTVTNGADQLVTETRADRYGAVTDMIRGPGSLDDSTFLLPSDDRRAPRPAPKPSAAPLPQAMPVGPPVMPPLMPAPPPVVASPLAVAPAAGTQVPQNSHVPQIPQVEPSAAPAQPALPSPSAAVAAPKTVPVPVPRPASLQPKQSPSRGRHRS